MHQNPFSPQIVLGSLRRTSLPFPSSSTPLALDLRAYGASFHTQFWPSPFRKSWIHSWQWDDGRQRLARCSSQCHRKLTTWCRMAEVAGVRSARRRVRWSRLASGRWWSCSSRRRSDWASVDSVAAEPTSTRWWCRRRSWARVPPAFHPALQSPVNNSTSSQVIFAARCYAVVRWLVVCPSVRLFVTFVYWWKRLYVSSNFFHLLAAPPL